jgi:NAD(P)-dependent dehydrogenase (short-subunit alcohol dehydrogenase family)
MGERDHKVAIITGGPQGIGAGLVAAYRRRDWAAVATSRTIKHTMTAMRGTGMPWAGNNTICARRQVTTDPVERRRIRSSRCPRGR